MTRSAVMVIRRVLDELEARLLPPDASAQGQGKLERKRYGDGTDRLKITVRGLDAPDGSTACVTVGGSPVTEFEISRGAGRADTETATVFTVPEMRAGEIVEVRVAGELVLSGMLRAD